MGRSLIASALIELQDPTSPEAQIQALRSLKNEIVGHELRKEQAITHGIVKPLAGILRAEGRKSGKKRRAGAMNGNSSASLGREGEKRLEWTTEDELRFQATLTTGSLASSEFPLVPARLC